MTEPVSVRPDLLATFAKDEAQLAQTLSGNVAALAKAFTTFVNSPGGQPASSGTPLVAQTVPALLQQYSEMAAFVQLVHDAVIANDVASVGGVSTLDGAALVGQMQRLATERGISLTEIQKIDPPISAPLPEVGTIPADSGYVNDPVCTATGHLVIPAQDFIMPPRLRLLTFERSYASGSLRHGAFGPGWWSWASVELHRTEAGGIHLVCPDGAEIVAEPCDGGSIERRDLGVTVTDLDGSIGLYWDHTSRYPRQTWAFDGDDRLRCVTGDAIGSNTFVHDAAGALIRIEHDSGRFITVEWERDRIVAVRASDGRTSVFTYDGRGRMVAVDNAIVAMAYEFDDADRITSFTDADGVVLESMEYDDDGRVVAQRSATGHVTRFEYAAPHRTIIQDADGRPISMYVHDARGRVQMLAAADGMRLTRSFDSRGRVVAQQNPDGISFALGDEAADSGSVEQRRWSTGAVERFVYDDQHRLTGYSGPERTVGFEYAGDLDFPTRLTGEDGMTFDLAWAYGMPISIIDADDVAVTFDVNPDGTVAASHIGNRAPTRFEVHPTGTITKAILPDGGVVRMRRDDAGRLLTITDAAGSHTHFEYSPAGRLQRCIDPVGAATTVQYDSAGTATRVIAADGSVTHWLTDDEQRTVGVRRADGTVIDLSLDLFGRPLSISVDEDRVWSTTRDGAGRPTSMTDPTGRHTRFGYSSDGLASTTTDPAGATWTWQLDLARRVSGLVTPTGTTESVEYGTNGNVIGLVDADSETAVLSYTPGGRVQSRTSRYATTTYQYDRNGAMVGYDNGRGWWIVDRDDLGRMTTVTSPGGRMRRYGYDRAGRLASVDIAGSVWRYEYDACGRTTRLIDPLGATVSHAYDQMGRLAATTDAAGSTTTFEYDPCGVLTEMTDAAGSTHRYASDVLRQPTSSTDPLGRTTAFAYDLAGRHLSTTFADGLVATDVLDERGQVHRRENSDGNATDFERDLVGRVVAIVESDRPVHLQWSATDQLLGTSADDRVPNEITDRRGIAVIRDSDGYVTDVISDGYRRTWQRDERGLLVAIVEQSDDRVSETRYERDAAGRVVRRVTNGSVSTYRYDAGGRLTSVIDDGVEWTWRHDVVGQLVRETGPGIDRTYTYDAAHQLESIVDVAGTTSFRYDARGRRVGSSGARTTSFAWTDDGLSSFTTDGVVTSVSNDSFGRARLIGGIAVEWNHGRTPAAPLSLDGRAMVSAGTSAVAVADDDGRLHWGEPTTRDPWGGRSTDHDAGVSWHPFFGPASRGLVFLGARVYDTTTRQFLTPDPKVPVIGNASAMWPYAYAANDPVNLFDPLGTSPVSLDEFNTMMDKATSVQTDAIVGALKVVAVVAVGVVIAVAVPALIPLLAGAMAAGGTATVGTTIAATVIVGAVAGGTNAAVSDLIMTGAVDPGNVIKGAVLGAASGGLMAKFGPAAEAATYAGAAAREGAVGLAESTAGELYDVTGLPGSDGSFDASELVIGTASAAGGGLLAHRFVTDTTTPPPTPTPPVTPPIPVPASNVPNPPTPAPPPQPVPAIPPAGSGGVDPVGVAPPAVPAAAPTPAPLPIRGNINSSGDHIYHTPASPYYDRTIPERSFATVADAEAAGFRPPLNMPRPAPAPVP